MRVGSGWFSFSFISGKKAGIVQEGRLGSRRARGLVACMQGLRRTPQFPLVPQPEGLPGGARRRCFPRNHISSGASVSRLDSGRDVRLTCDLPLPLTPSSSEVRS